MFVEISLMVLFLALILRCMYLEINIYKIHARNEKLLVMLAKRKGVDNE